MEVLGDTVIRIDLADFSDAAGEDALTTTPAKPVLFLNYPTHDEEAVRRIEALGSRTSIACTYNPSDKLKALRLSEIDLRFV